MLFMILVGIKNSVEEVRYYFCFYGIYRLLEKIFIEVYKNYSINVEWIREDLLEEIVF